MQSPTEATSGDQGDGSGDPSRRTFMIAAGAVAAMAGLGAGAAQAAGLERPQAGAPAGHWLAGDTHVHDDHSSDGSGPRQISRQTLPGNLPVGDQIAQGERNGLDFMPLTDHRTYDQVWDPQFTSSALLLLPGEEANGSPHAITLGNVDVIVDGANPPGSALFRHVQQSIWDAHAQAAVWSQAHPDDGEYTPEGGPNANASAQGADLVEVFNVGDNADVELDYAENRWNAGFRFGVAGASDSHFREYWDRNPPGTPTTRVFAAKHSARGIIDGFRAGRTSIAQYIDGPAATIEADVDGDGVYEAISGDEVVVPRHRLSKRATLRVTVTSGAGTRVLVYANPGRSAGRYAEFQQTQADQTYVLPLSLGEGDHSWYRVELRSPGAVSSSKADPNQPDQLRATAAPIFVSVGAPAEPQPEIPLPDADTTDDGATVVLGEVGSFAGFSDVAIVDGVTHVVAEVHTDHESTVVYRRINRAGAVTRTVTVSGRSATARFPRIAATGDDVWIAWEDERGMEQPHRPVILLAHSRNGGSSFTAAGTFHHGGGRAIRPALALLDGSHPLLAWSDNARGAFDVYAQVIGVDEAAVNLSAAGKITSEGVPTDARSPRFPASLFASIAVHDGRAVITWQDNRFDPDPLWTGHTPPAGEPASGGTDPDNWQILAAVRPSTADGWGTPVQVSQVTDRADRHPSVAVGGDGTVVAIWESGELRSSGTNLQLRASQSTDGGLTWTGFEQVALAPAAMSQRAQLGTDPDGTVRAVWYDSRADDWRWKVFTATLDGGSGWSAANQVSHRGNNTWPSVSSGVVAFTSDRNATRTQRDATQQIALARLV